ncbi:unnamed protein product [Gongylonema pulchrum]|uniref:RING-type domain-containing protein n=1 Tax=Gongylonema pulchrum TaxID=637853 RepID=A0A183ELL8_9BILA|nr:unnamed protein product [Gongylonema pulchrum]
MKESKSENISENVVCWLCNSYLIDAVSLSECMHSYCRSCLLQSLDKGGGTFRCLKCDRPIARDLSEAFARDNTIQNLVYKSAPDVFWQELKQRGEYLKKRAVPSDEKALILDKKLVQLASELCAPNEVVSLCLEYISPGLPDNEEEESEVKEAKQVDENKPSTVADADRWEKQEAQMTSFRRLFLIYSSKVDNR